MRRERRHALVFSLFVGLILLGLFKPSVLLDDADADDWMMELREPFILRRIDSARPFPVPYGYNLSKTEKIALDHVPPGLCNVTDDSTLLTTDFFENLQIVVLRKPYMNPSAVLGKPVASSLSSIGPISNSIVMASLVSTTTLLTPLNVRGVGESLKRLEGTSVELVLPTPLSASQKRGDSKLHQTTFDAEDLHRLNPQFGDKKRRLYDLPRARASVNPTHGWRKFYIALNLYMNEDVIPFITGALVAFIEDEIAPFFDVASSVVVSIFSSESKDHTAVFITDLLVPYLHKAGVRHVYVTTNGTCLGYKSRQPFHERIEWMACLRNKALEPLYEFGMNVFGGERCVDSPPSTDNRTSQASAEDMVILFMNDIFFRPHDITTLLESVEEPGIAAEVVPDGTKRGRSFSSETGASPPPSSANGTTFDMACGMDFYFNFYDVWVTRDRTGNPFIPSMPYVKDPETVRALSRIFSAVSDESDERAKNSGRQWAVPVKCCWNGVAAMRGSLFLPSSTSQPRRSPRATGDSCLGADGEEGAPVLYQVHCFGDSHVCKKACSVVRNETENESRKCFPRALQRLSGAVYDAMNSTAVNAVLIDYYMRLLLRRVQHERLRWIADRAKLAKMQGIPYTPPGRDEMPLSLPILLEEVTTLLHKRSGENSTMGDLLEGCVKGDWKYCNLLKSIFPGNDIDTLLGSNVYYVARQPSLRFRHSIIPSYGATAEHHLSVDDSVCLSSECFLICQDVMHAVLLRHKRVPVILLNPNVRVAYTESNYDRVTTSWIYSSPKLYEITSLTQYLLRWWKCLWGASCPPNLTTTGALSGTASQHSNSTTERFVTGAWDDWTREQPHRTMEITLLSADPGKASSFVEVDVNRLTHMVCGISTSTDYLSMGPVTGFLLWAVVLFLLWYLIMHTTTAVVKKRDYLQKLNRGLLTYETCGPQSSQRAVVDYNNWATSMMRPEALLMEETWWLRGITVAREFASLVQRHAMHFRRHLYRKPGKLTRGDECLRRQASRTAPHQ